jgi:hypothetical protein
MECHWERNLSFSQKLPKLIEPTFSMNGPWIALDERWINVQLGFQSKKHFLKKNLKISNG